MARTAAAKSDPRQVSIFDVLGDPGECRRPARPIARIDPEPLAIRFDPPPAPVPEPGAEFAGEPVPVVGEADPRETVADVLDDVYGGPPPAVDAILSAEWTDGVIVARLRMWDEAPATLTATPAPGGYKLLWDFEGLAPPHWDHGAWRRGQPEAEPAMDEDEIGFEPQPEYQPDAVDLVVRAGLSPNRYIATLGALQDPDHPSPHTPRSTGFPVELVRPPGSDAWELHLSTPACASLPFVRRVAEAAGIEPVWRPDHHGTSHGQWHHAVDLANDEHWEELAATMQHSLPRCVERAVGLQIVWGNLSTGNARSLLAAIGVQTPECREVTGLTVDLGNVGLPGSLDVWSAIHAIEDGLVKPGSKKNYAGATLTATGWRHIGLDPPAAKPGKTRRRKPAAPAPAAPPAVRVAKPGPSPADVAYVQEAIVDILPKGWPSYAIEVLRVRRTKASKAFADVYRGSVTVATLRLFDGEIGKLTLAGSPGAHGYSWAFGLDKRPFEFDEKAWLWKRVEKSA